MPNLFIKALWALLLFLNLCFFILSLLFRKTLSAYTVWPGVSGWDGVTEGVEGAIDGTIEGTIEGVTEGVTEGNFNGVTEGTIVLEIRGYGTNEGCMNGTGLKASPNSRLTVAMPLIPRIDVLKAFIWIIVEKAVAFSNELFSLVYRCLYAGRGRQVVNGSNFEGIY